MAKRSDGQNAIYSVRSLEEAKQIINAHDKKNLSSLLAHVFVSLTVRCVNIFIGILKFILFRNRALADINIKNIVIYTVGIVGDNVVLLPALAAIRRKYHKAYITVISNCQTWDDKGATEILSPSSFKDRLIIIKDYPVERRGCKLIFNKHLFPNLECDLFINLSPFGNRGWIGAVIKEIIFAYKIGASYAVGFHISSYSRKNYFNKVKHCFLQNEPRRSRGVLQALNIKPIEGEDLFEHDNLAKESVINKLCSRGWQEEPLFVINPGAKFAPQCWPADRFGKIAKYLATTYGGVPIITGISSEKTIADVVAQKAEAKVINLAGLTSIQELVELLRMAKACITNDTGTMHIAAMIGLPTVAVFSSRQSPTHWFPIGKKVIALFCMMSCAFCYNDNCEKIDCLKMIEPHHVIQAMNTLLKEG